MKINNITEKTTVYSHNKIDYENGIMCEYHLQDDVLTHYYFRDNTHNLFHIPSDLINKAKDMIWYEFAALYEKNYVAFKNVSDLISFTDFDNLYVKVVGKYLADRDMNYISTPQKISRYFEDDEEAKKFQLSLNRDYILSSKIDDKYDIVLEIIAKIPDDIFNNILNQVSSSDVNGKIIEFLRQNNQKKITDYFDDTIQYPFELDNEILPINILWEYVPDEILNVFLKFGGAETIAIFSIDRYTSPDVIVDEYGCKTKKHLLDYLIETSSIDNINQLEDDFIILQKTDKYFIYFYFDMDTSDCVIGRFKTNDDEAVVIQSIINYLDSECEDKEYVFEEDLDSGIMSYTQIKNFDRVIKFVL